MLKVLEQVPYGSLEGGRDGAASLRRSGQSAASSPVKAAAP
jgi:hypothetical protein